MGDGSDVAEVRCRFYARLARDGGLYRYEAINVGGPRCDGCLATPHPPQIGDLIYLWDPIKHVGGTYEIIARSWLHAGWGSTHWPYGSARPEVGPSLDFVVGLVEGVFRNEAPLLPDELEED